MLSSLKKVAWNAFGEAQSWAAGRRNIGVSVLILLLTVANTYAQHTDEYEYMVNYPDNSTVTLTRYTGSARAVVIPDVIDDMPVTGIGDEVFSKCVNMTGVMIPESVTNIGFAAFYGCSGLTTIALPEGVVSIGASAFEACWELTAITIPPQVTRIGDSTFGYCRKLTRVELPDILVYIGVNAFYLCDSLVSVRIPASVTTIDRQAFITCSALTGLYFLGNAPSFGTGAGPFYETGNVTVYYLPGTTGWGAWVDDRPAVPWNPQVQSGAGFGIRSGHFGFGLTNAGSPVVVIEACTNLAGPVWFPVSTNTLTGGCFAFSDTQTTNHPARFYRFRMPITSMPVAVPPCTASVPGR